MYVGRFKSVPSLEPIWNHYRTIMEPGTVPSLVPSTLRKVMFIEIQDEWDLLNRIFSELRDAEQPLSYSELARGAGTDRHVVAGMMKVLAALDVVVFVYKQPTTKLVRINEKFDFRVVKDRIKDLLKVTDVPDFSREEWVEAMDFLIPRILSSAQVTAYATQLEEDGFARLDRTVSSDFFESRLGASLPRLVRALLTELFYELLYKRMPALSKPEVLEILRRRGGPRTQDR